MIDGFLKMVLDAQADPKVGHTQAVHEIAAGAKRSHWIWYEFPILRGVRSTSRPQFEIPSLEHAVAWLHHPILGPRLLELTSRAVTHLEAGVTPTQLFGGGMAGDVDASKFHESATLFLVAASQPPRHEEAASMFARALQALRKEPSETTLGLLSKPTSTNLANRPSYAAADDPHLSHFSFDIGR